jgi:hypothetical protein
MTNRKKPTLEHKNGVDLEKILKIHSKFNILVFSFLSFFEILL